MSETAVVWVSVILAAAATAWRARHQISALRAGPRMSRSDQPGLRIAGVLEAVGLHRKLLQRPLSGALHALIFVSFFVLFTATMEAFGSRMFPGFSLKAIGGNTWIAALQDVFSVVMLAGVGLALYQRYVLRPKRYVGSDPVDALVIYLLILLIVLTLLIEAAAWSMTHGSSPWRPVTSSLASAISASGIGAENLHGAASWLHIFAILAFLIYIPGSKHRHMFLAAPNVYFRSLMPKGQIPSAPPERTAPGATKLEDFDWKQKLDLLSCTECGRCQDACPAYASGLPLSPKTLIMDLRDGLLAGGSDQTVFGNIISEDTIWACTTCRACMEVCPVEIEHLPKIIDLRRHLVDEGRVSRDLQTALTNFTRSGNSMGKPARMRSRWTKDLPFAVKDARDESVDVLWFVGDYASYDQRAQLITQKVAHLLHAAGVDFGILHDGERNSGNDVRRAGEEGLFESLAQENIDAISACSFKRIMTTDPHSLNALKNDYRHLGSGFDVTHHTALLAELIDEGRLAITPSVAGGQVTYHDPCYLGRYNGGYDAPRRLIEAAGYTLTDMKRCRENSFCCGAGGGRIWQNDDGVTERPSENRIREALELGGISLFVVACPKDKVMYTAAIEALGVSDRLQVLDVAELLEAGSEVPQAASQ